MPAFTEPSWPACWAALLVGLAGLGLAVVMAAEDLASSQDMWDGLGVAIGTLLALPSLVITGLSVLGLRQVRRRELPGRGTAAALAFVLVLPWVYLPSEPLTWALAALALALALAVLLPWARLPCLDADRAGTAAGR